MSRRARGTGALILPIIVAITGLLAGERSASAQGPAMLAVRTGEHPGYGRLVFDWPTQVGYQVSQGGQAVTVTFNAAARIDVAGLHRALPNHVSAATTRLNPTALELNLVVPENARVRHFRTGSRVVLDILTAAPPKIESTAETVPPASPRPAPAPAGAASSAPRSSDATPPPRAKPPVPLTPEGRQLAALRARAQVEGAAPASKDQAKPQGQGAAAWPVTIDVADQPGGITLSFNWRRPVSAAVFRDDGWVWIVFDQPARFPLDMLPVGDRKVIQEVQPVPAADAAAIKLRVDPAMGMAVRQDGTRWDVSLGQKLKPSGRSLDVVAEPQAQAGGRVVVSVATPGRSVHLVDPVIGDRLQVIPLTGSIGGVFGGYRFVDFHLLASAQGIAVRAVSDGIAVATVPKGVAVSRPGGLTLSRVGDVASRRGRPAQDEHLLDLRPWSEHPATDIVAARQQLQANIAALPKNQQSEARFDLARFFVAHGLAAEASGTLETAARDNPTMEGWPKFKVLRAAAEYLAGHYAEADRDFSDPLLVNHPIVQPFRAATAAARLDWVKADELFADLESVLSALPPKLGAQFMLLAAEASLAVNNLDHARTRLQWFQTSPLTDSAQSQRVAVLEGHLKKRSGDADGALAQWAGLAGGSDRISRARADLARVTTLRELKKLSDDEAIDAFKRMRFAWRGDVVEYDVLHQLSKAHLAKKDYREALLALRMIASYFPDVRGIDSIDREMRQIYRDLYLNGGADALTPVSAIALFDEFQTLLPDGPEQNIMVRKLVDRMAEVDLVHAAAGRLEQLIKTRLKGVDKVDAATRLAELRLDNREARLAVAALDQDAGATDLPAELTTRRRHVRARALIGLGRRDEALAALRGDSSPTANGMRADIHWQAKEWPLAAATLAQLVASSVAAADGVPRELTAEDARLVLRWALALNLGKDHAGLKDLRARLGKSMSATPLAASFDVVTGVESVKGGDFRRVAESLGDVAPFEKVLAKGTKPAPAPAQPGQPPLIN